MTMISASLLPPGPTQGHLGSDQLRDAAVKLEAAFLSEMLSAAGLGEVRQSFSGGTGEDQFSSFLVQAQADRIARTGGIGLAEMLFRSLSEESHGK